MSSYVLRPSAVVSQQGTINSTGSPPTLAAAIGDNSDSTYITMSGPTYGNQLTVQMGAFAPGSTEIITQYRLMVRYRTSGGGYPTLNIAAGNSSFTYTSADNRLPTGALITATGPWRTAGAAGETPTVPDSFDYIKITAFTDGGTVMVYDAWIEVTTNSAPIVNITTPTNGSTIVSSQAITAIWTVTDADGDAITGVNVKMFTAAQYGATGFNPTTSSATAFNVLPGTEIGDPLVLPNNTNVRIYVQAKDLGSGIYGAWTYTQVTVAVPPLVTPYVTATNDAANARVVLSVQGGVNQLSANDSSFENGVGNWLAGTNTTVAQWTFGLGAGAGTKALRLTATTTGNMRAYQGNSGSAGMVVIGGQPISWGLTTFAGTTTRNGTFYINWYQGSGAPSAITPTQTFSITSSTTAFTGYGSTATAPADAVFATYEVGITGAAAGEQHYVDKIYLTQGTHGYYNLGGNTLNGYQIDATDDGLHYFTPRLFFINSVGNFALYQYPNTPIVGLDGKLTAYDYDVPSGVTRTYRVLAVGIAPGGSPIYADYATPVVTTAFNCSFIKDPADPSRNISVVMDQHGMQRSRDEGMGVHYGFGRPEPIVIHGTIRLSNFNVTLFFKNDAEYAKWKTLQDSQRVLLLQTGFGNGVTEQYYFEIGTPVAVEALTTDDMKLAQGRRVTLSCIEKAPPAVLTAIGS